MGKSILFFILFNMMFSQSYAGNGITQSPATPADCSFKALPGSLAEVDKALNGAILDEKQESCVFRDHEYDMTKNEYSKFYKTFSQIKNELAQVKDDACLDPKQKTLAAAKMICESEFVGERSIELAPGRISKHAADFKNQLDQNFSSDPQVQKTLETLAQNFAKAHRCFKGVEVKEINDVSSGVSQLRGKSDNLEGLLDSYRLQLNSAEERVGIYFSDADKQKSLAAYEKKLKEKIAETQKSLLDSKESKAKELSALYASAVVQNQEFASKFGFICTAPVYKSTLAIGNKNKVLPDVHMKLMFDDNSNEIDPAVIQSQVDQIRNNPEVSGNLDQCKRKISSINVLGSSSRLRNTAHKECPNFDFVCLSQKRADRFRDAVLTKAFPGLPPGAVKTGIVSSDGTTGEECPYRAVNEADPSSKLVALKSEYYDPKKRSELDQNRFVKVEIHFSGECELEKSAPVAQDSYLSQCKVPVLSCK